ncbi:MAG: MarR family transcriptional regulator [Nitrosopumilus sp.]|uniref:MarR family transcriptional regulator n=1 Tax=Nitrosopumilus sp. TaxID=2024843 RepID=UPI00292CD0DE|nr:MarR family transcriptional regulator [Nitrosopumilus sp.]
MGGAKKTTNTKQDKSTSSKDSKKGKKDKGESGSKKAEIIVMLDEQQAMKIIQHSKVITVQDLARQTGVKISAANAFLKDSAEKGTVKRIGGYSGHHLYQPVSS